MSWALELGRSATTGSATAVIHGGVLTPFGAIGVSKNEFGGLEVMRPVSLNGHGSSQQQVCLTPHPSST